MSLNDKVHDLLLTQIAAGRQTGTQVCAYRNGEVIVDTWAGTMGPHDDRPVQSDSLFSSYSTTKGVAAALVHMLADRGRLDYEAPVAKYWPEFAQHGKERVTVAQAMSHQAGLHRMPESPEEAMGLLNWEKGLAFVADGTPLYEPGTKTGYHALTYAWVAGGIVRGATGGGHIGQLIQSEIAQPLGVGDQMYVGIPDGVEERLTTLKAAPRPAPPPEGQAAPQMPPETLRAMPFPGYNFNSMEVRKACLPSANGHFSARALARMYGALANAGQVDGVRLCSADRIPHMYRLMTDQPDIVIGMPIRKGIGFFLAGTLNGAHGAQGPRETAFGHPGAGGSIAFADPEVGLSIAVTLNQMQPAVMQGEGVTTDICDLIRNELGLNA